MAEHGTGGGAGERDADAAARIQIMTTMHAALATARASTVAEANGRAGLYLTSVSTSLVALAFVAQATALGPVFYLFAFALLGVLVLVGLVTFDRVVQTGVEDSLLAEGEARVRAFYAEAAPGVERWLAEPADRAATAHLPIIGKGSRAQLALTTGGMIAVVNSALAGVGAALALSHLAGLGLAGAAGGGLATFAGAYGLHVVRILRAWRRADVVGIRRA